eukprot:7536739-Pyramimonas_sp.AAC.1
MSSQRCERIVQHMESTKIAAGGVFLLIGYLTASCRCYPCSQPSCCPKRRKGNKGRIVAPRDLSLYAIAKEKTTRKVPTGLWGSN